MRKFSVIFLVAIVLILIKNPLTSFAKENNSLINKNEIKNSIGILNNENGKNKFQLRVDERKNSFMVKGVITASETNSLKINNMLIKIDSSITGEVKTQGETKIGMYAMVQGIINNSDFYAKKIVVDQRNKHDLDENDNEEKHLSPSPVIINPTITATSTPTLTATESSALNNNLDLATDLGNIITKVQEFLNYLKEIASRI